MDRRDDAVRLGRQEAVEQMAALDRVALLLKPPLPLTVPAREPSLPSALLHHGFITRGLTSRLVALIKRITTPVARASPSQVR
jgi:hypothetical protein